MYKNVLAVFSPKHDGPAPLEYALKIADKADSPVLHLLYVIPASKFLIGVPMPPYGTFSPIKMRDSAEYQKMINKASQKLSELERPCEELGIRCKSRTIIGNRGLLTAELATFCQLMICEKRPEKQPIDTRRRRISLAAIAGLARIPVLAVPKDTEGIKVIHMLYDGTLKSSSHLRFAGTLASMIQASLGVFLVNGPEFRAEDMEGKVQEILSVFFPHIDANVSVLGRAKLLMDEFGGMKESITVVGPYWWRNFKFFGLPRNRITHAFEGPVALVP